MRNSQIAALAGVISLTISAGVARAATVVTFDGYASSPNPGEMLVTGFEGGPTLADVLFDLPGYSITGTAALLTGSSSLGAAPAFSDTTRDPTQYLSVEGGQTATIATPSLNSISFYVGSLDGFNSVMFTHVGGATELFTGSIFDTLPSVNATGDQQSVNTNGRLSFVFSTPITGFELMSGNNSFEISDIAAMMTGIPEPTGWALMVLGLGGVGGMLRRRRGAAPAI